MTACPGAETLVAFAEHALADADARAVEEHIDVCRECRAVVGAALEARRPARVSESKASTVGDPLLRELAAELHRPSGNVRAPSWLAFGSRVGRYLVLEPLGAGGMGVVHLAYDPQLDRRV